MQRWNVRRWMPHRCLRLTAEFVATIASGPKELLRVVSGRSVDSFGGLPGSRSSILVIALLPFGGTITSVRFTNNPKTTLKPQGTQNA